MTSRWRRWNPRWRVATSLAVASSVAGGVAPLLALTRVADSVRVATARAITARASVPVRSPASDGANAERLARAASPAAAAGRTTPGSAGRTVRLQAGVAVALPANDSGVTVARGLCLTIPLAPDAAAECDDLRVSHALPSVTTRGVTRAPVLTYSSAHATGILLVGADVSVPGGASTPDNVVTTLDVQINGVWQRAPWPRTDAGSYFPAGQASRVTLPAWFPSQPTGLYPVRVIATAYRAGVGTSATATGQVILVNRSASRFGGGWWLEGYEQLLPLRPGAALGASSDSVLWVGGDGSARVYVRQGGGTVGGATEYLTRSVTRPDSLFHEAAGTWTRRLGDRALIRFDAAGHHTATVDRLQNTTWFDHAAGTDSLLAIRVPVRDTAPASPVGYTLAYAAGRLASVTGPGGRVAAVHVDATNRLTAIVEPTTTDSVRFTYAYDPQDLPLVMSAVTDRRGATRSFLYEQGFARLRGDSTNSALDGSGTTIVTRFCAAEAAGLLQTCLDRPVPTAQVSTFIDGPLTAGGSTGSADLPAGQDDTTRVWLDRFGGARRTRGPLGDTTLVVADAQFPGLPRTAVSNTGLVTTTFYNARGLPDSVRTTMPTGQSPGPAVTRYTWDPYWSQPTRVMGPDSVASVYAYDASGNLRQASTGGLPPTPPGTLLAGLVWENLSTGARSITSVAGPAYVGVTDTLQTVTTDWSIAASADFNADGKADLVWQNLQTGQRSIWFMDGTAWPGPYALLPTVSTDWRIVGAGDFNGDGQPDLVWHNTATGESSIWFMNGATYTNTYALLPTEPVAWSIAAVGDFTGDGKPDLVWQNLTTGERAIWTMNGATWNGTYTQLPTVSSDWRIVGAMDVDGDGKTDLIWQSTSGDVSAWLMNGTTWPGQSAALPPRPTAWRLAAVMPLRPPTGTAFDWTTYTYSATGLLDSARAARAPAPTSYTHDALGNDVTVTSPAGAVTTLYRDALGRDTLVTTPVDAAGAALDSTRTVYDLMDRPWFVETRASGAGQLVTTTYDGEGLPLVVRRTAGPDLSGQGTLTDSTVYDAVGRPVRHNDDYRPGLSETTTYDAAGDVTSATNRRGQTVTMTYDALGRLRTRSGGAQADTLTYGPGGQWQTGSNAEGRDSLAFDAAGRPATHDVKRGAGGAVTARVRWGYDVAGRVRLRSLVLGGGADSSAVRYHYDPTRGWLDTLTDAAGRPTVYTYTPEAQPDSTYLPGNVQVGYGVSWTGAPAEIKYVQNGAVLALGGRYSYDERIGRYAAVAPNAGTAPTDTRPYRSFAFDSLGRLTKAVDSTLAQCTGYYANKTTTPDSAGDPVVTYRCRGGGQRGTPYVFSYDGFGNRSGAVSRGNRLTTMTGTGVTAGQTWLYSYDADGNALTRTGPGGYTQSLTWSSDGALTQVTTNGAVVGYGYDAFGRRVRRTDAQGATYSVWAGDDLAAMLNAGGQPTAVYTYEPGVDAPLSVRAGGPGAPAYTYARDALGNVVGLLDAAGQVAQKYAYGPYGEQEVDSGAVSASANALRFKAREFDPTTGFYYARARWYDPISGRFLSEDPVGLSGGVNEYAFAGDDPVNGSDPYGLMQVLPTWYVTADANDLSTMLWLAGERAWFNGFAGGGSFTFSFLLGEQSDALSSAGDADQQKPKLPQCNDAKNNRSRFFEQLPGIRATAKQLNVAPNLLVGLASYESGWLDDHNFALNNLWGLTHGGKSNLSFSSIAAGNAYFVKDVGPHIQGAHSMSALFSGMREYGYNSVNPNYYPTLANRINNIPKWEAACGVK